MSGCNGFCRTEVTMGELVLQSGGDRKVHGEGPAAKSKKNDITPHCVSIKNITPNWWR